MYGQCAAMYGVCLEIGEQMGIWLQLPGQATPPTAAYPLPDMFATRVALSSALNCKASPNPHPFSDAEGRCRHGYRGSLAVRLGEGRVPKSRLGPVIFWQERCHVVVVRHCSSYLLVSFLQTFGHPEHCLPDE